MVKSVITCFFLLLSVSLYGQQKYTISGTVKDSLSGESIISAMVRVKELSGIGITTNEYGFYSLTIPKGTYQIKFSFFGYKEKELQVNLDGNVTMNISLSEPVSEIEEIVVKAIREDKNVTSNESGVQRLDVKEISKIPVIFGEKDVIKTLQLTPGIKSGGDGNAGLFVRGGAADQNLILLDEAVVYNPTHLLGFFSTFNSDAIKDLTIYKGSMPAQYGGRLSSVLDVKMNEGNTNKYNFGGGIGILSSRLYAEGPIVKDKGSFLITARRTYLDFFLKATENFKDYQLYFYDLNFKGNYKINDKNRIYLSGYFGQDRMALANLFGLNWGNGTGTIRWNSIINPKLFSNTSLIFSNYSYSTVFNLSDTEINVASKIRDYRIKQDFTYIPNPKNKIKFGLDAVHHTITPGQISSTNTSMSFVKLEDRYSLESGIYFSHEIAFSEKFNLSYGLRGTSFQLLGKGTFYEFNELGNAISSQIYNSREVVKSYFNLEPRMSMSYILNQKNSVKFGYTRNTQNLHLLSNSTTSNPTDLWIASSKIVKPEISDQVFLGYFQNFKENKYEFSTEVYFKYLNNQIDFRDGASILANELIEGELLFGIGRAYGIELLLKKKKGKFNGWISYTLSKTEKKINGINKNEWYAARQDKTHDISIVGIYDLNDKWSFSATWVYSTGNAVTFPSGKYIVDGQIQFLYTERNGYRMPSYHRLDIGVTWYKKKTKKFESSWNLGCYNAYGNRNPYTITFRQNENDPTKTEAVMTSLFRWVPSITYNFKF
jgi:hypothetical protein